jgi:hypothetical protein
MLETHIVMSLSISRLILTLMFHLAFTLVFLLALSHVLCLTLLLMLYLSSLMDPNHHSYGFGPRENCFEPRCFSYGPRPHRGDRFPRRSGFSAGGFFPHFESRYLDSPHFSRRGSRSIRPSGEVQMTVKTSSGRMVKCWIPKIYLTNPGTEPSTFSHHM